MSERPITVTVSVSVEQAGGVRDDYHVRAEVNSPVEVERVLPQAARAVSDLYNQDRVTTGE